MNYATVVMLGYKAEARPVAVVSDFAAWRAWFKIAMLLPGERVVQEKSDLLEIEMTTGYRACYYPARTLLNPQESTHGPLTSASEHITVGHSPSESCGPLCTAPV